MQRKAVIERQSALLKGQLYQLAIVNQHYALVDFPAYSNVGDSAIWMGAVQALRSVTGRRPSYVCSKQNYDANELRRSCPSGPIFILGGGNLGDLWPGHTRLRLALMQDFPGRQIVQLPQSIHFDQQSEVTALSQAIKKHGNFTLMVRDEASFTFARQHFPCEVIKAPDCALAMNDIKRYPPSEPYVFLRRTDKEDAGIDYSLLAELSVQEVDWVIDPDMPKSLTLRARLRAYLQGRFSSNAVRQEQYNAVAAFRVQHGLRLLSKGAIVITDRLHAYILSAMAGIPVVAFDNSYGKVSGYRDMWMPDMPNAYIVSTSAEALAAIESIKPQ